MERHHNRTLQDSQRDTNSPTLGQRITRREGQPSNTGTIEQILFRAAIPVFSTPAKVTI